MHRLDAIGCTKANRQPPCPEPVNADAKTVRLALTGGPDRMVSSCEVSARYADTLVRSEMAATTERPPIIQSKLSPARQILGRRPGTLPASIVVRRAP